MGHITQTDINFYAMPFREPGAQHALIQSARQIRPADPRVLQRAYRTLRTPVQLIWCAGDQAVPLATGQRLAHILPRARLAVLDRCDHVPLEQRPRATARLIMSAARR